MLAALTAGRRVSRRRREHRRADGRAGAAVSRGPRVHVRTRRQQLRVPRSATSTTTGSTNVIDRPTRPLRRDRRARAARRRRRIPGGAYLASTDAHESDAGERAGDAARRLGEGPRRRPHRRDEDRHRRGRAPRARRRGRRDRTAAPDAGGRVQSGGAAPVPSVPSATRSFDASARVRTSRVYFVDGAGAARARVDRARRAPDAGRHGIIDLVCGPRADELVAAAPAVAMARRAPGPGHGDVRQMVVRSSAARGARVDEAARPATALAGRSNFVNEPAYEARFVGQPPRRGDAARR